MGDSNQNIIIFKELGYSQTRINIAHFIIWDYTKISLSILLIGDFVCIH